MFKVAVGVGVLWAARAAVAEPYPDAVVDRPVLLNPGMTEVDAEEGFGSTTDGAFRTHQFSVEADHQFGPVQLDAFVGYNAALELEFDTYAIPAAVYIEALSGAPQSDNTLHESQSIGVEHKAFVAPHVFSLRFGAGIELNEDRNFAGAWRRLLVAAIGATGEVQLAPALTLLVGGSLAVPVERTGPDTSSFTIGAGLIVTIASDWDVFAHAGFNDVTTSTKFPYADVGITRRFGR
jgi:hypothetical protein